MMRSGRQWSRLYDLKRKEEDRKHDQAQKFFSEPMPEKPTSQDSEDDDAHHAQDAEDDHPIAKE